MRNTIIRNINRKQFTVKYLILNLITIVLILSNLIDKSAVLYMLVGIFAPICILVYESVIIVGRLHDINRPAIIALLLIYLKFQIMMRLFIGVYDPLLLFDAGTIIYVLPYLVFILILCIRETSEKIL